MFWSQDGMAMADFDGRNLVKKISSVFCLSKGP